MRPSDSSIPLALASIFKQYGWSQVAVATQVSSQYNKVSFVKWESSKGLSTLALLMRIELVYYYYYYYYKLFDINTEVKINKHS